MKRISIPPNYFYLSIILILPLRFIFPGLNLIPFPVNLSGIALMIAGLYVVYAAYKQFMDKGTPEKFEPSTCVVSDGLYKYSRNPMYAGGIVFLAGLTILTQNVSGFFVVLLFFLIMNSMFIPFEEKKMERECGESFLEYKKKVRRWL